MAFKLRSGNSPMFKSIGEEKETPEQYNARVRAEHEAKMQAYDDSTASYKNQVELDNIMTNLEDEVAEYDAGLIAENDTMTSAEYEELNKKHNKEIDKNEQTMDEAFELHDENVERGIYDPKGIEWRGERNPEDLRPTKPREPMEMIDPIKIKNIDMGGTKVPEKLQKLPPYELTKNNPSYFTVSYGGAQGTWKKEDGLPIIQLKDQAGRVVWKGGQTEYHEKYGDFLEKGDTEYGERKKHRLYLKE
jgi:hypothetical protein